MEQIDYFRTSEKDEDECIAVINELLEIFQLKNTVRVLSVTLEWRDGVATITCWYAYSPKKESQ